MMGTAEHQRFREKFDEETKRKFGAERVRNLMAKRRPGHLNDDASIGPGVKVIFHDFQPVRNGTILEQHAELGIEGTAPMEDMEYCYALELPDGGFVDGGACIFIFKKVGPDGETADDGWLTTVGWAYLLRLEGANGELMQNLTYYQPNGSSLY